MLYLTPQFSVYLYVHLEVLFLFAINNKYSMHYLLYIYILHVISMYQRGFDMTKFYSPSHLGFSDVEGFNNSV